jgi:SAM-dependent methyltransferase
MEEWFRDWFSSEDYLEVYQHRDDEDAKKLVSLIYNNVGLNKDSFILDAACGAGRHLINLSLDGYNCFGFDLSKTLLKRAMIDSGKLNLHLNLFCADIRKIYLKQRFDLVMNLFTSFGYFKTDEENFRFAFSAFQMLKENGIYVLDFLNSSFVKKNLLDETEKIISGKTITEKRSIRNERVVKEITIKSDWAESSYVESVKLYDKQKITDELLKIGFKLVGIYGDYEGSGFDADNSPRLILFLKK